MSLTRRKLRKLNENELRTEVLIPLFKAMGFQDVRHTHGGVLEQGKDIVMWKPDEFRGRINYGVVVKAAKISGKATGKSSANEVYFQIEQCINASYLDPVSMEEQRIHRCLVICSKEITKEGQKAIEGILRKSSWDRVTEFIDGDKLWELVEKHLPKHSFWEKLEQADQILAQASSEYRINYRSSSKGIELSIEPKSPESLIKEPLQISARLNIPNTLQGLETQNALQKHILSGAPVTIQKPFIEYVSIPEFLKPFMPSECELEKIEIGTMRSTRTVVVNMQIQTQDGEKVDLDYIQLNAAQIGSEEMTLTNDGRSSALKLKLVLSAKEKTATFNIETNLAAANVEEVLRILRFMGAIAKGGIIRISDQKTRLELLESPVSSGSYKIPDPRLIELLEDLSFIQRKVQVPIYFPDRDISIDEVVEIKALVEKLRTGFATVWFKDLRVSLKSINKDGVQTVLENIAGGKPAHLRLESEETYEIFGAKIPLGRAIYTFEKVEITAEGIEKLENAVESGTLDEIIDLRLIPVENCPMKAEYPNWTSEQEPIQVEEKSLD